MQERQAKHGCVRRAARPARDDDSRRWCWQTDWCVYSMLLLPASLPCSSCLSGRFTCTDAKSSQVTECLSHTSSSPGVGCPADSEGLGRAGWTVLHTMVSTANSPYLDIFAAT